MNLRKSVKRWLYGSCPGIAGAFPYFGSTVYFPKGSLSFFAACDQGIFEADNVRLLQAVARPETVFFDIGANIGLMSLPVLHREPKCRVVAFEPSPNVLQFLQRTIAESADRDRWMLVPKAVGAHAGRVIFTLSDQANSLFDGIRPTHRVGSVRQVEVDMTTVDETWHGLGSPRVCLIKCDVEGAEWEVLKGARECLRAERPVVLLEWNVQNLAAYNCSPHQLLVFAHEENFQVLAAAPTLVEVRTAQQLALHMAFTESFLLCPFEKVVSLPFEKLLGQLSRA